MYCISEMYCIISVSFSTKCFPPPQIILSSCLSHELQFKYSPQSVEVQDVMEVKLSANKHSVLYLPLARTKKCYHSLAQTAKESGYAAPELCLVFMLQAFCVCVFTERIQSEYGELCTTYTIRERKKYGHPYLRQRTVNGSQLLRSMNGSSRLCT
jgi:hypothetical protein